MSAAMSVSISQLQKKIRRHKHTEVVEATAKDEITLVSVSVQNKTRQIGQRAKKYQYLRNTKFKKKASVRHCEGKAREKGDTQKKSKDKEHFKKDEVVNSAE